MILRPDFRTALRPVDQRHLSTDGWFLSISLLPMGEFLVFTFCSPVLRTRLKSAGKHAYGQRAFDLCSIRPNTTPLEVFRSCIKKALRLPALASSSLIKRNHEVRRISALKNRFRASWCRGQCSAPTAYPRIQLHNPATAGLGERFSEPKWRRERVCDPTFSARDPRRGSHKQLRRLGCRGGRLIQLLPLQAWR